MKNSLFRIAGVAVFAGGQWVGCGSSEPDRASSGEAASSAVSGARAPAQPGMQMGHHRRDGGAADSGSAYPAAHTPVPQIAWLGHGVVASMKTVTITFAGDPYEQRLQEFGRIITSTPWWDAVREGYCDNNRHYCVGRGNPDDQTHAVLDAIDATSFDDSQAPGSELWGKMQSWIDGSKVPSPVSGTAYVIYVPQGVPVTSTPELGTLCSGYIGYHAAMDVTPKGGGVSVKVPYAVVARCDNDPSEARVTMTASHEMIEMATDPNPRLPSYQLWTDYLYTQALGGEVADACVYLRAEPYVESGFTVERSWSNLAAMESRDPCVPAAAGEVYFNVAARNDVLSPDANGNATFEFDAYSDGPTADWAMSVVPNTTAAEAGNITLTIDHGTVNNGSSFTVAAAVTGTVPTGGMKYWVISTLGAKTHRVPIQLLPPSLGSSGVPASPLDSVLGESLRLPGKKADEEDG